MEDRLEVELEKCLNTPLHTPNLSELIHKDDKVLIVVDDSTRPTPKRLILPILLERLNALDVTDRDVEILIALGTHRPMTDKEIRNDLGENIVDRVAVSNHCFDDENELLNLGRTPTGIPVEVNKRVVKAHFVIGIGNIAPHHYAGWGGGSKIVQPGICGEETTAMTHLAGAKTRPISSLIGNIDNQVRKEIDSVAIKAGLKFIINTVLNDKDEIVFLAAGDPVEAFRKGVERASQIFCPQIPSLSDIVILSTYPADADYWQALKALQFANLAVKKGGSIVLTSPCPDGVSPEHGEVLRARGKLSFEENLKAIESGEVSNKIAGAGLLIGAQVLERCEVICFSDGLKENEKESLGLRHATTVDEAVNMAWESQGKDAKIGIMKCGEIIPLRSKLCYNPHLA